MTRLGKIICIILALLGLYGCITRAPTLDGNAQSPTQESLGETREAATDYLETPTTITTEEKQTASPEPINSITPSAVPTLEADQAEAVILGLFTYPEDCVLPCLWTISPGETTLIQARNFFAHLAVCRRAA